MSQPVRPLAGRHVIVTSGPTHEPIDPVRYIANRSSGAQGSAIAAALRDLGAKVSFVTGPAEVPPLIKGYLRAGAWICGEPAWDPDFNTADLPILMPMAKVSGRYAKHYLGQDA